MSNVIRVALYARVSSDRQADHQTIDSQIAALEQRIEADGCSVEPELRFLDDGISGSILQRPALERLRDLAYLGGVDRLYVLSPDRLARTFAHQVLLLEEFQKHKVEVTFLNNSLAQDSAEGALLLQIQGVIAEYERAKILERTRRGRRFAARQGRVSALGGAPYGYHYRHKTDSADAAYEVDPQASQVLVQIFIWVGVNGMSLGEVTERLFRDKIPSPAGNERWDRTTVRELLRNPAYTGAARFGKTQLIARTGEPASQRRKNAGSRPSRKSGAGKTTVATAPDKQEIIKVPALVSLELFQAAGERLDENRRRYREQKKPGPYLLGGMLQCSHCKSAYCGRRHPGSRKVKQYVYYHCLGTDAYRHGGHKICSNRPVPQSPEQEIWSDVCQLLQDRRRLRQAFAQQLTPTEAPTTAIEQLERCVRDSKRRLARLIDAYETGLLEKATFEERTRRAKQSLEQEEKKLQAVRNLSRDASTISQTLDDFERFAARIQSHLADATDNLKRQLFKLLIDRIEIGTENIRIIYKVNLLPFAQTPNNGGILHHCLGLRRTRWVRVKT